MACSASNKEPFALRLQIWRRWAEATKNSDKKKLIGLQKTKKMSIGPDHNTGGSICLF